MGFINNDYVFNVSPFLHAYFKIATDGRSANEKDIIDSIEEELISEHLHSFQKCSMINQCFKKENNKITDEDNLFVLSILNNTYFNEILNYRNI